MLTLALRLHRTPLASSGQTCSFALLNLTCDDAIFRRDSFTRDCPVRLGSRRAATPRAFRLEERKAPLDLTSPVAPRLLRWLSALAQLATRLPKDPRCHLSARTV